MNGKSRVHNMLRPTEYTEFIKMASTRLKLGAETSARHFRTALESTMASDAKKPNVVFHCAIKEERSVQEGKRWDFLVSHRKES